MASISHDIDQMRLQETVVLSEQERERYRRQLMLPGFTPEHQQRLRASTAFVAGIGGLGGTAALYLAVAGIGKLVLAHAGNLTLSNMNRQVLMKHDWIGRSRVIQAKRTIEDLNPDVAIVIHDARTADGTIGAFLNGADIALSARPNFAERLALHRACVQKEIPLVEAAMNGMEGYCFNVIPGETACLSCVYPEENPEWEELGFPVLGAVSGMLGCMMAIEAIKLLTGYGKPLSSEMLHFSTLDMVFSKVRIPRSDDCPICGHLSVATVQES
jgi:molybdopterin/thiamine biosynthesis adenylyltransferase